MNLETIVRDFKSKVCEQLRVTQEGENRFRVFTPFSSKTAIILPSF